MSSEPRPRHSNLSYHQSYAFSRCFQQRRGQSRVHYFYKDVEGGGNYTGAALSLYHVNIAWNLSLYKSDSTRTIDRWIYLREPSKTREVTRRTVLDRFNAILERENLPALRIVKRKWVFDDGARWTGSRLFHLAAPRKEYSFNETLEMIRSHP